MQFIFCRNLSKTIPLVLVLISFVSLKSNLLKAEYLPEEMEIDSSTKSDGDSSAIPTNPFEIVEMMRRYNSLNDATNPSDAIDEALKSFNGFGEKEEI